MYEIKSEDVYEGFRKDKEIFHFSNYSAKSKYYDDSNKLIVGKMVDKTGAVAIEKFIWLKPKVYSFLVEDSSEHKKANDVNKNVVATIIHSEHKDVLLNKLNNKCFSHSLNRI